MTSTPFVAMAAPVPSVNAEAPLRAAIALAEPPSVATSFAVTLTLPALADTVAADPGVKLNGLCCVSTVMPLAPVVEIPSGPVEAMSVSEAPDSELNRIPGNARGRDRLAQGAGAHEASRRQQDAQRGSAAWMRLT